MPGFGSEWDTMYFILYTNSKFPTIYRYNTITHRRETETAQPK